MARSKIAPPDIIDVQIKQDALDHDRSAANQLALVQQETATRVRAVAQQLGYQLPVESADPDLIQRDIAANMRRSVEACLEVGRGLRVLKEACVHGNFMARLEVLGLEPRVAQRFMQSATKFSNASSTPLLKAVGNQTKLFEMLVLDDEQIEELELTGETGELSLDDVATMSVKELRTALRKERKDGAKVRTDLERQEAVNEELHAEARRIKRQKPDEAQAALHAEASDITNNLLGLARGDFRQALLALSPHGEHADTQHLMAGMVGQLQAVLTELREEFGLPDVVGDGTPEWQRWAAAQGTPADNNVPDLVVGKASRKPAH